MFRDGAAGVLAVVTVSACGGAAPKDGVPPPTGTVSDVEGNVYPTIVIGQQEWMVENLKTTTYNDGTPIPNVTDADTWTNLASDAYCWYGNDGANKDLFGGLYNWYAVQTGKLCPTGWVMPSTSDWGALALSLGGPVAAGGPMKEAGTAHWHAPNVGATNQSGFTALPGGGRELGQFIQKGGVGIWWTSYNKAPPPPIAYCRQLTSETTVFGDSCEDRYQAGFSVRCFRSTN